MAVSWTSDSTASVATHISPKMCYCTAYIRCSVFLKESLLTPVACGSIVSSYQSVCAGSSNQQATPGRWPLPSQCCVTERLWLKVAPAAPPASSPAPPSSPSPQSFMLMPMPCVSVNKVVAATILHVKLSSFMLFYTSFDACCHSEPLCSMNSMVDVSALVVQDRSAHLSGEAQHESVHGGANQDHCRPGNVPRH